MIWFTLMCLPENLQQGVTHFECVWSYLNVHNPNWKSRKSMECWWAERRRLTTGTDNQMEVFKWPTGQGRERRTRANLFKLRVSLLRRVQPVGQCADIRTVAYPWQHTQHWLDTQRAPLQPQFLFKVPHGYLKILHRWQGSQPPLSRCTPCLSTL